MPSSALLPQIPAPEVRVASTTPALASVAIPATQPAEPRSSRKCLLGPLGGTENRLRSQPGWIGDYLRLVMPTASLQAQTVSVSTRSADISLSYLIMVALLSSDSSPRCSGSGTFSYVRGKSPSSDWSPSALSSTFTFTASNGGGGSCDGCDDTVTPDADEDNDVD